MSLVDICNPATDEEQRVPRSTLGRWRQKGWVIAEEKAVLNDVEESVLEDSSEQELPLYFDERDE